MDDGNSGYGSSIGWAARNGKQGLQANEGERMVWREVVRSRERDC
jgi:hypothetical protein